ncbi:unnamed protein product [Spodoptera exigua]|nr:unnamed protein product [Spodoptera exigua]
MPIKKLTADSDSKFRMKSYRITPPVLCKANVAWSLPLLTYLQMYLIDSTLVHDSTLMCVWKVLDRTGEYGTIHLLSTRCTWPRKLSSVKCPPSASGQRRYEGYPSSPVMNRIDVRVRELSTYDLINLVGSDLLFQPQKQVGKRANGLPDGKQSAPPMDKTEELRVRCRPFGDKRFGGFDVEGLALRYQAIVRPMRPRMSKTCSLVMIACIWISGMLLAIPCLLYSTTKEYRSKGTLKTACLLSWPDGLPDVSYMDFVYQVLFFVVTYAIPMLGMTFFYSAMGKVLWGSGSIGELTQRQVDSIRSKRKVVKMFILVIVIFGICWLPYHCYFIYTHFNPSILYMKYVQHMYLGFYWLAMANAMVNPIIYYWMNAKFRTYFRTAILCRWRDILRRRKRPLPESPPDCISQSGSRSRSGASQQREHGPSYRQLGLQRHEPPHNTCRFKENCLLYEALDPSA